MNEHISLKGYGLSRAEMAISLSVSEPVECPFCHNSIETQALTFFQAGNQKAEIFVFGFMLYVFSVICAFCFIDITSIINVSRKNRNSRF